jgi:hypothetical protein
MQKKIVNTFEDCVRDASTFLSRDITEISNMKSSSFSNIEKFASHSLKKIDSELKKHCEIFFPRSTVFNTLEFSSKKEEIENLIKNQGSSSNQDQKPLERRINEKRYVVVIDPITNIKGLLAGVRDFCIAVFLKNQDTLETEASYIYNPNTDEMITLKKDTLLVNERKYVKHDIKLLKKSSVAVAVDKFSDLRNLPKITGVFESVFMSNDKYSKLIEFVSNKADFFIKPTFSEESDYEIRNILKKSGYSLRPIKSNGIIDFSSETISQKDGLIASSRSNMETLKSLQDKTLAVAS